MELTQIAVYDINTNNTHERPGEVDSSPAFFPKGEDLQ